MKTFAKYLLALSMVVLSFNSCKRQDDFLNVKQNLNQVVPSTLKDFQAILDNYQIFNNNNWPIGGDAGSDNVVAVSDATLTSISPPACRNMYLWAKDIYQGATSSDWIGGYTIVEYTNIVLDGLSGIAVPSDSNSLAQYNNIKGSALFFRSFAFYRLSSLFCKPYNNQSAGTDLGLVLRLTSDVTKGSTRSTVQQSYDQMISDLQTAIPLLPLTSAVGLQARPTRPAAYALLAKVYLAMSDYKNAAIAATNSLSEFNTLLDYNNNSLVHIGGGLATFPAFPNNPEISFYALGGKGDGALLLLPGLPYGNVDPGLYSLYDNNDLRKTCFYSPSSNGGYGFTGSYKGGSGADFVGIATNEVLLIQAECYARTGDVTDALADLNALLVKRYKTGTFTPLTISNQTALLNKILLERRKELPFLGYLRWEDLRRLNQDPNYAVTLTRTYLGQTYTLPPNDPRYVLPIPDLEIQLTGIQQNQR